MAARRLLIILVLLLAASVVAAALAPDRTSQLLPSSSTMSTTSTIATTTSAEPTGASLTARINASSKKPQTVEASVGDQLALSVGVAAEPGRTIWIEDLGLTEFAAPEAPAHFNLLLQDPGRLLITDERGAVVGRIDVADPAATAADDGGNGKGP